MLERIFQGLLPYYSKLVARATPVILVGLALAGLGLWATLQLRIDGDFANLIPSEYPSVRALERLQDTIGGESEAAVVIESPSFAANKRYAEALIPAALALQGKRRDEPYFTRIDYRREVGFLQDHALYFATGDELDSLQTYLEDRIEQAKLEANPFYFDLDDEDEDADEARAEALRATYEQLVGKEYPVSDDSTVLVLRFYPGGSRTDINFIRDAYRDLQALAESLEPASYHPQMEVILAGRLLRQLFEVQAITEDVRTSFGSGVVVLLLMVVAYFFYKNYQVRAGGRLIPRILLSELARTPITALLLGIPLLAGEAWTFGVAYAILGTLNIMTSTLGLVLFGLGIDFGIHFYARYAEERGLGRSVPEALEQTFITTGLAITGVGLTTAAAFYILMVADFRGFSEFGFVAGTGILLALVAMLVLMPALLVFFERTGLLHLDAHPAARTTPPRRAPNDEARTPWVSRTVIAVCLIVTGLSLAALHRVAFEYDFGALEPVYEDYNALQSKARRVYSDQGTRNAAYILTDTPEDADAVARVLRARAAADTLTPTIRTVESLQDRFPMTPTARQAKLERLAEIRSLLDDPFLSGTDSEDLTLLRRAAATAAPITLDEVPDFLKRPFLTKQGEVGNLVIIYPSVGLSDGRKSMQFSDDVGTVTTPDGHVYHAGSTSIVASDMLRLMQQEAPLMLGLTILLILVFKLLILHRLRWVLLALLPLAASFVWMFGIMVFFGLKLNFYNLVVLPTVLGIGDDSGIHIVHRYLEEGRGSVGRVLQSTGEHTAISALTTMVGFGGLLFSMHPGMRSIGVLAVLGIGMTLVAALVFLPALLIVLEKRDAPSVPSSTTA